jgi:phage recombination protein Bet
MSETATKTSPPPTSVIVRMAERYGIEANKYLAAVRATAFKAAGTEEQLMALFVVAEQYGLNPWTKEIFAFPDKSGGVVPVVGVDGWARIINSHAMFDGLEFNEPETERDEAAPAWIECVIYRKDRTHPTKVREYFKEVNRGGGTTSPWVTHPRRMLRHKALIQCARLAFGFAGIYDQDEAERIIEAQPRDLGPRSSEPIDYTLRDSWVKTIVDLFNSDKDEYDIAQLLRDAEVELNKAPEIYTAVLDYLASNGHITKKKWREYLDLRRPLEGS